MTENKKICPKCGEEKSTRGFAVHVLHCKGELEDYDEEHDETLDQFLKNDEGYNGNKDDLENKRKGLNKIDLYKEYEKMKDVIDRKTTGKEDEEENECGKCGKKFKDIVKFCPFCGVEFDV